MKIKAMHGIHLVSHRRAPKGNQVDGPHGTEHQDLSLGLDQWIVTNRYPMIACMEKKHDESGSILYGERRTWPFWTLVGSLYIQNTQICVFFRYGFFIRVLYRAE